MELASPKSAANSDIEKGQTSLNPLNNEAEKEPESPASVELVQSSADEDVFDYGFRTRGLLYQIFVRLPANIGFYCFPCCFPESPELGFLLGYYKMHFICTDHMSNIV